MPQETEEQPTRGIRKPDPKARAVAAGINYLLVIGIDKYRFCPPLYNAVKDARDLVKLLHRQYLFSPDHTEVLYNGDATQGKIYQKLGELDAKATANDNLVVYFSGHGEYKKTIDEGFWIPVDGKLDNHGSFLAFSMLTKYIRAISTRHTVVIADSCYAGSFFTERKLRPEHETLRRLYGIPSRWLLTAGRNEVVVDGKPGDNSPFADSLLWHLTNQEDGMIGMRKLSERVITDVSSNARQIPRGEPIFNVGHRGGEFLFIRQGHEKFLSEVEAYEETDETPETTRKGGPQGGGEEAAPQPPPETPKPVPDHFESVEALKSAAQRHLAQNEIERVFTLFDKVLDPNASLSNDLILTRGQYNGLQRDRVQGLVTEQQATLTLNRVRNALLYYVKRLEKEDLKPDALKPPEESAAPAAGEALATAASLKDEAQNLRKKITFFKEEMERLTDPNQRFNLKLQIEEAETRLKEVESALEDAG